MKEKEKVRKYLNVEQDFSSAHRSAKLNKLRSLMQN